MSRFEQRTKQRLGDPSVRAGYREADAEIDLLRALDDARRRKGLTQNELARRLGCTQSAVSQFFGSESGVTIGRLVDYLDALGLRMKIDLVDAGNGDPAIAIGDDGSPDMKQD